MKSKFMSVPSFIFLIFLLFYGNPLLFSQTFIKEVNESDQIILIDKSTGKQINDMPYDLVDSFYCGLARVRRGLYFGYINKEGIEYIPCDKYIEAGNFSENLAPIATGSIHIEKDGELKLINKNYGMINLKNEIIIPVIFKDIRPIKNNMIAAQDHLSGLWGFVDKTGKWTIPSKYIDVTDFNSLNLSIIQTNERKYGVINQDGNYVAEPKYYFIGEYNNKRAKAVIEKNKEGYIDENGQVVIDFKYAEAFDFSNGFARVVNNQNLTGYLDVQGKETIAIEYQYIHIMQENGCVWAQKNFKFGVINVKNETVKPFDYDIIVVFDSSNLLVSKDGLWGLFSLKGVERIPVLYQSIQQDSSGLSATLNQTIFKYNADWKIIKKDSFKKPIVNRLFVQNKLGLESLIKENRGGFSIKNRDDLSVELVEIKNKFGLRNNKTKKIILPCQYDSIKSPVEYFNNDAYALLAFKDNQIKLISVYEENNDSGDEKKELKIILLPDIYDVVHNIEENQSKGLLRVGIKNKFGILSLKKDLLSAVLPIEFEDIGAIGDNIVSVKRNGFWGIWDFTKQNLLSGYEYEKIGYKFSLIAVKKEGKWGFLNPSGNKITDYIYEDVSDFLPLASFALVKKSNKWGIINENNTVLIGYIGDNMNEPPNSELSTKISVRIADMIFNLNIGSIGSEAIPVHTAEGENLYNQPFWAE